MLAETAYDRAGPFCHAVGLLPARRIAVTARGAGQANVIAGKYNRPSSFEGWHSVLR
jgi:hypothetical protein